jgi:hypothetical protein
MTQRNIISVIGDMENFLDSLLAHTEEENCQHSVSDFLQEFFDNSNSNSNRKMAGKPGQTSPTTISDNDDQTKQFGDRNVK